MINSKLLRILKSLRENELKQLDKFIASPFFNESKTIIQLFAYLRKQAPEWEDTKLEKEKVWKKLFPQEVFSDVRFRQFMSQLFHLVEKFIAQHIHFKPEQMYQNRMSFYQNRYLDKDLKDCIKEWENYQYLQAEQSEVYYHSQKEILLHKTFIYFQQNNAYHEDEYFLPAFLEANEQYFIITQLKWACVALNNHKRNAHFSYKESSFLPNILKQVEENDVLKAIPTIHVYYLIYQLLTDNENEGVYDALSAYMQHYPRFLTQDEWTYLAAFLRNYCIRKVHDKSSIYLQRLQDAHIVQLNNGTIFSFNLITAATFRNIIQTALNLNEYEWVKDFIVRYKDRLAAEEKDNLVHFGFAKVAFAEKKWKESLKHLNEMLKSDELIMEIQFRILQVKNYYELQEWEIITNLLETFNVYVFRQESLSEYYKNRYKHFIQFMRRMIQIEDYNTAKRTKLIEEIKALPDNNMVEKEWILEKMETLLPH